MEHFTWTQLIPGVGHHYASLVTIILIICILMVVGYVARIKLLIDPNKHIPSGHFGFRGIFEVFTEMMISLVDMVMGSQGRKFVPFFAALFLFILANNLAGMIPGVTPATQDLNLTLAMGLSSFAIYNYYGFKEHGMGYLKHFMGPLIWLAPLMLPIELISHLVRPLSLGLRLYGNMTGDHTVLGVFLDLTYVIVPIAFYLLGIFICFVQALVFTLLTMVYLGMATAHEH